MPVQAERYSTQGENTNKSVWVLARKLFEERMNKSGRTFGPSPFKCGPPQAWLVEVLGSYDSCGAAGNKYCTFGFNDPAKDAAELCKRSEPAGCGGPGHCGGPGKCSGPNGCGGQVKAFSESNSCSDEGQGPAGCSAAPNDDPGQGPAGCSAAPQPPPPGGGGTEGLDDPGQGPAGCSAAPNDDEGQGPAGCSAAPQPPPPGGGGTEELDDPGQGPAGCSAAPQPPPPGGGGTEELDDPGQGPAGCSAKTEEHCNTPGDPNHCS